MLTPLPISNFVRSKKFYRKLLKSLGYRQNMQYGKSAGFFDGKNTDLWITAKKLVVPTHLAFQAGSSKQVEAFYQAGLDAGGKANGSPGYRDYSPGYYAAFIYDPDGNNVEAVWYDPKGKPKPEAARKKRGPT